MYRCTAVPCSARRGGRRVGAAAPQEARERGEGIGAIVQREDQAHSRQSVSHQHGLISVCAAEYAGLGLVQRARA